VRGSSEQRTSSIDAIAHMFNFDLLAIACTCTMPTAATNKPLIARAGGVPPLITLAASTDVGVSVEAVAALANLAVNGT